MKNKLFVIGNGFDLVHNIPTRFNPDFKRVAERFELEHFWDLYQSKEDDIWADFENLLGSPDFNNLEVIFDGYAPNYASDREGDRDGIITQVDINGNLQMALYEFASQAESSLRDIHRNSFIEQLIDINGFYVNFNYTHTLEQLYGISYQNVLHIHGEVGANNLMLGYPQGQFSPEKYSYDYRGKGRGPFTDISIDKYIDGIEDFYIRTAYEELVDKCKSFNKRINTDLLINYLKKNNCNVGEITVYGHSCKIDFDYFKCLNSLYPDVFWTIYTYGNEQANDTMNMIRNIGINNSMVRQI